MAAKEYSDRGEGDEKLITLAVVQAKKHTTSIYKWMRNNVQPGGGMVPV